MPLIGDGARVLVARALEADEKDDAVDRTLAVFLAAYEASPAASTVLLPGATAALSLGLPIALVTNKPRSVTLSVLRALGIADAFAAIFAGGDGPLKPAADGLLAVASSLSVRVEDAWLVGDGPQDVLAGRAAGCTTIAVAGIAERARVVAAGPDWMIESLVDLGALVETALVDTTTSEA